jgi:hypothetical protein
MKPRTKNRWTTCGLEAASLKTEQGCLFLMFANATIVVEDIGVFHQLGDLTMRGKTHAHDKLCSPHDGSMLTAEPLKVQSMGQTRADKHDAKHDLETQGQNTRTEKGMENRNNKKEGDRALSLPKKGSRNLVLRQNCWK